MCSGSLPTNSIFPISPLIIPAPQLNKCHIWSLERAKKKKLLATWRPTGCGTGLNLIFLFFALGFQSFVYVTCEILAVISCFFFIFLKTIFLSLFHELLPRLRPYSVDESLTKLPTDDELCYFYFFKLLPCPSSNAWDIAILFIFIMNYYHHFSNILVNFMLCMPCALFHISINQ